MLKLEFLQYHDVLSDRQVMERAQTDVAYRYFLDLGLGDELPDPSSLCVFRGRLGAEGHRGVFQEIVAQAREHGLVKDRLRQFAGRTLGGACDAPARNRSLGG